MTVIPFPDPHSRKVHKPGRLSVVEDVRSVSLSRTEFERLERLALSGTLSSENTELLFAICGAWRLSA